MNLFRKTKQDELFGRVTFHRGFVIFGGGYWCGKARFPYAGEPVDVFVNTGKGGIKDRHREFWIKLISSYGDLEGPISELLLHLPSMYFEPEFAQNVKWDSFELDSVTIPDFPDDKSVWCLSYSYVPLPYHFFYVQFEGSKPVVADYERR